MFYSVEIFGTGGQKICEFPKGVLKRNHTFMFAQYNSSNEIVKNFKEFDGL